MNKSVVIFGAGIAGLSAAHYLNKLGYQVHIYESLSIPGGLARSIQKVGEMPSEYSWRGFGPWYHNTAELLNEIDVLKELNIALKWKFLDKNPSCFTANNILQVGNILLNSWTSNERSKVHYTKINAYDLLKEKMKPIECARQLSWIFGPFVGVDASRASVHHVSSFFQKNAFPMNHTDVVKIKSWSTFNQPINEAWFNPWVKYLTKRGVKIHFNHKLKDLKFDSLSNNITSYTLVDTIHQKQIERNDFNLVVLAIDPFSTAKILRRNSELTKKDAQLSLFDKLIEDGPHIQISFRIGFEKEIVTPFQVNSIILLDSEYDITMFFENSAWKTAGVNVDLGSEIKTFWSGTACLATNPGKLFSKPMNMLTREEFTEEIKYQIFKSKELNDLIKRENHDENLISFPIAQFEIWYGWTFLPNSKGIVYDYTSPKWVNSTQTQEFQPTSITSINNLYLAGAHTKTYADLYSMEAAVESGKRVADIISHSNTVNANNAKYPLPVKILRNIDDTLFKAQLPQVLNFIWPLLLLLMILVICFIFHLSKKLMNYVNYKILMNNMNNGPR
jgi:uncharacterized protein with NAD-binding domain and iron-sulfur cluster